MIKEFLRNNRFLIFTFLVWIVIGKVNSYLGGGVVFASFIVMFFQKRWGDILISFYFLLLFSDSRESFMEFANFSKPFITILIGGLAIRLNSWVKIESPIYRYFVLFFIIAGLCLFNSPVLATSFQKTLSYILVFFSVPVYIHLAFKDEGELFFKRLISMISLIFLVGILGKFIFPDIVYLAGRYRGLLGNPNGLGLFFSTTFLLFNVIIFVFPNVLTRKEKWIFLSLALISLFMSKSRQAMMIVFIFYSLQFVFKYSNLWGIVAFFVLAFGFETVLETIPIVTKYLGMDQELRVENVDQIKNGSGRLIAWNFAWEKIRKDNFYFGGGFAYTLKYFQANRELLRSMNHMGNAHNTYLTIWLNTGLFGLLAFLGGLIKSFSNAGKIHSIAFPVLFSLIFSLNYESWLSASLNPFTIIFVIILAILFLNQQQTEKENEEAVEMDESNKNEVYELN